MPTQTASTTQPHTAITSWSGYLYQGKVALYHVLCLLENREECNGYKLQLDLLEDFAILNAQSTPVSLHQVKAKKTQYYSGYQADVTKVKKKASDNNCDNAYFHSAREITDKTATEIASEESPVKLYEYNGQFHCEVDEIDNKIEAQLKKLWQGQSFKETDDYARIARQHFDQLILKQVLFIHGIIHTGSQSETEAAANETIGFDEFIGLIDHHNLMTIDQGEEYWLYVLLNDMHQYYQEYCVSKEDSFADDVAEKLATYMHSISKLEKENLLYFVRNITPHRKVAFNSLSDYKDKTFNKDDFRYSFLAILEKIKSTSMDDSGLLKWEKSGESYFPTTISSPSSVATDVCTDIVENFRDTDLEVLYERSKLITTEIDVPSISEAVPLVVGTEGMDETDNNEHRILNLKKVALIPIDKANGEIND